jgi:hypothetical protein
MASCLWTGFYILENIPRAPFKCLPNKVKHTSDDKIMTGWSKLMVTFAEGDGLLYVRELPDEGDCRNF